MQKLTTTLLACILTTQLTAQVFFVNIAAPSNGSGNSWLSPFNNFHDALNIAPNGSEIWIAKGTYFVTADGNKDSLFSINKKLRIIGGFAGIESMLDERDLLNNQTILDGNIGNPNDSTDNTRCLFSVSGAGCGSTIDGLVFQNATASIPIITGPEKVGNSGAAIFVSNTFLTAAFTIKNCQFLRNGSTKSGGAIFATSNNSSSLIIENSSFSNCSSRLGGAVTIYETALILKYTTFKGNKASNIAAGLFLRNFSGVFEKLATVENCAFEYNLGGNFSAMHILELINQGKIIIEGCIFKKNQTINTVGASLSSIYLYADELICIRNSKFQDYSDGISIEGSGKVKIDACSFISTKSGLILDGNSSNVFKISINNSLFLNNLTGFEARIGWQTMVLNSNFFSTQKGRLLKIESAGNNTVWTNNLFINSDTSSLSSISFGGALGNFYQGGKATFINNSFLFKKANSIFTNTGQVSFKNNLFHLENCSPTKPITFGAGNYFIENNLFNQDSTCVFGPFDPQKVHFANQLFDTAFAFQDTAANDYRLPPCSPAINAGQNAAALDLLTDYAGNPRIQDGQIDLGALESDQLAGSATANGPVCGTDQTGKISFALPNGCLPAALSWTNQNGQTGTDSTGLEKGIYAITLTDGSGKKWSDTLEIAGSALVGHIDGDTLDCFGANQAQLTVKAENGIPPVQYQWSNGQNSAQIDGLGAGIFIVEVIDSVGCMAVDTVEILETELLQASFALVKAAGPTAANGAASVDVFGGTGPFQIQWSTGDTTKLLTGLLPGFYQITITDAGGCSEVYEVEIGWTSPTNEADGDVEIVLVVVDPGSQKIRVLSELNGQAFFELVDAAGRRLFLTSIQKGISEFDVHLLQSGLYFYRILQHHKAIGTGKIRIQN